jgi:hypothetical protein
MNNQANIPGAGTPLTDKDGRITQVWWPFLVSLFNRTGAGTGVPPVSADGQDASALSESMVAQPIGPLIKAASSALIASQQVAPSNAALLARVAALEAAVAALTIANSSPTRRMSDLDAEINSMVTPPTGITGTVIVKG